MRELTAQSRIWRDHLNEEAAPRAIARLLHTFKGNARMAGAMNLGEVTHLLETRVHEAIKTGGVVPALIDDIESGIDTLAQSVERLRLGPQTGEAEQQMLAPLQPLARLTSAEGEDSEGGLQKASLRVRAELVDRLVNEAGELSIARTRIEGEMRSLKGSLLELTENAVE